MPDWKTAQPWVYSSIKDLQAKDQAATEHRRKVRKALLALSESAHDLHGSTKRLQGDMADMKDTVGQMGRDIDQAEKTIKDLANDAKSLLQGIEDLRLLFQEG